MNCRPGDLAVYVGRDVNCLGRLVRCVKRCPHGEMATGLPHWVVDPPLPRDDGLGPTISTADRSLRPIRDPGDDATDETLAWAGKLQREHA